MKFSLNNSIRSGRRHCSRDNVGREITLHGKSGAASANCTKVQPAAADSYLNCPGARIGNALSWYGNAAIAWHSCTTRGAKISVTYCAGSSIARQRIDYQLDIT